MLLGLLLLTLSGPRWGNKAVHEYAQAARAASSTPPTVHPLHVAFAAGPDSESAFRLNSAAACLQLPVDWAAVLALAERGVATAAAAPARVVRRGAVLHAADQASAERLLADALLERDAAVEEVAGPGCVVEPVEPLDMATGCSAAERRGPNRMEFFIAADALVSTRDADVACWPKVWRFARMLLLQSAAGESIPSIGEPVPVKWDPARSRWAVGNRHRPAAHLLTGIPLRVSCRTKQVLRWEAGPDGGLRVGTGATADVAGVLGAR